MRSSFVLGGLATLAALASGSMPQSGPVPGGRVEAPVPRGVPDVSVANKASFATDVIYQVFVDRFENGDLANDPAPPLGDPTCADLRKVCGGDWRGVIQRIEDGYLTGMGISAIWISPPVENTDALLPDGGTAYHGYWGRDWKRPNPWFGTWSDFDELVQTAHAHGVKVVIDFTPNHTSPADEALPSYVENGALYDDGVLVGTYTGDVGGYFHHNGSASFASYEDGIYRNLLDLADLDQQHPEIVAYMGDAIRLWLDHGADGIRVDVAKHMASGWQKAWVDQVFAHAPVFPFAEWFVSGIGGDPLSTAFANESGMSLVDFPLAFRTRAVFRNDTADMTGLHAVIVSTEQDFDHERDLVTFLDNHDIDRFHIRGADPRRLEIALAFLLTARGVPAVYYGTEQYMTGTGDPENRKPMTSFDTTTTAYRVIASLAPLRKENPALAYGDTEERWLDPDVYVYEREFAGSVALVALNRGETTTRTLSGLQTALPAGTYADELAGLLDGVPLVVDAAGLAAPFDLGPRSAIVWQHVAAGAAPAAPVAPVIGRVGPTLGQAGRTIAVDGRGFGPEPGQVLVGGVAAPIASWNPTHVVARVPAVPPGDADVVLRTAAGDSDAWPGFRVLSAPLVPVRFVVHDATTFFGQCVYLVGDAPELGAWDTNEAIGPFFNQIMHQYPSWYFDVAAPAGTTIEFKFAKKFGASVVLEGGANHVYAVPASGPGEVQVVWQP